MGKKTELNIKQILLALPVATIIFASFVPMQTRAHQALVLFTMIWFFVYYLFDIFNR